MKTIVRHAVPFVLSLATVSALFGAAGCTAATADGSPRETESAIHEPTVAAGDIDTRERHVETHEVRGWVRAGDGVSGATIRVVDRDGHALSAGAASFDTGTFVLRGKLPESFRVVVQGGDVGGAALEGTLSAEVAGFGEGPLVYVHPATTLVSAYRDHHPTSTVEEASAAVRRYLGVPEGIDVAAGLRGRNPYFSGGAFLRAARNEGGLDALVRASVEAMDRGETRQFQELVLQGTGTDLLAWGVEALAKGAMGKAGAMAFTEVLSLFGTNDPTFEQQALSDVQNKLGQISNQLTNLGNQLASLGTKLGCDIADWGYEANIDGAKISELNEIDMFAQLMDAMVHTDPKDTAAIANYKRDIRTLVQARRTVHVDVHDIAAGTAGTKGAIRNFSTKMKACSPYLDYAKSQALGAQFDFLAAKQVVACQMLTNYFSDQGMTAMVEKVSESCEGYFQDLQSLTVTSLPDDRMAIDPKTGKVWWFPEVVTSEPRQFGSSTIVGAFFDDYTKSAPFAGTWSYPSATEIKGFFQECPYTESSLRACEQYKGLVDAAGEPLTGTVPNMLSGVGTVTRGSSLLVAQHTTLPTGYEDPLTPTGKGHVVLQAVPAPGVRFVW